MITVVISPRHAEEIVANTLSKPLTRRYGGVDRMYRLYICDAPDNTIIDPITGEQLVASRRFATEAAAIEWISQDDRQRRLLHSAKVKS